MGKANMIKPIPTGGMERFLTTVTGYMFKSAAPFEDDSVFVFENLTGTNTHWLHGSKGGKRVTFKFTKQITNAASLFYGYNTDGVAADASIILDADLSLATNFVSAFRDCNVQEVIGEIDLSSCTTCAAMFYANCKIEEIRFKANSMHSDFSNTMNEMPTFSNDTRISIANCLNEGTTGKSVKAAWINNYTGNLGDSVLDPTSTYHIFVPSETGTMTLADFVTNVKGWTLAS